MTLYSTFVDAIHVYTGLSPAAFFTILALMLGVYRLVSSLFVSPSAESRKAPERAVESYVPPPEPVQIGDVPPEELRKYDGSDPKKPLLMAIKGNIYDVSMSRMFYGPGGPYALFAGRDATRALALMSFDISDLTDDIEGLSSAELEVLQDWEYKFMEKYPKVGRVVTEKCKDAVESKDLTKSKNESSDDSKDKESKSDDREN